MLEIDVTENSLVLRPTGLTRLVTFGSRLPREIPLAHVVTADIAENVPAPKKNAAEEMIARMTPVGGHGTSMHMGSGYWQWSAGRQFLAYSAGGERVLFYGRNPRDRRGCVTIKLSGERYTQLVLATRDPDAIAARIRQAIGGR